MRYSFNEVHSLAIAQAIAEVRHQQQIGLCYVYKVIYVLSTPAFIAVLEVLTVNDIYVIVQENNDFMLTSSKSHAILYYNR